MLLSGKAIQIIWCIGWNLYSRTVDGRRWTVDGGRWTVDGAETPIQYQSTNVVLPSTVNRQPSTVICKCIPASYTKQHGGYCGGLHPKWIFGASAE